MPRRSLSKTGITLPPFGPVYINKKPMMTCSWCDTAMEPTNVEGVTLCPTCDKPPAPIGAR